jgi:CheY-like chemotaxis protein
MDDALGEGGRVNACDYGLALVVASSPINRIVVSRIVQGAGLKVLAETPDDATTTLEARVPAAVVLDGGADNRECEHLMEKLEVQRSAADGRAPFVILLTNPDLPADRTTNDRTVDAIVAKPITPERLQPLIHRMLEQLRA